MFGGGGGLDPKRMEQMMKQMGIDVEELDANEVIIRTADGDLVFDDPDVTKMDARGQETYQIIGEATTQAVESDEPDEGDVDAIPSSDIEIVAQRAGVSEEEAESALEDNDGDLASAIASLE